MRTSRILPGLASGLLLGFGFFGLPAHGDVVTDWNAIAIQTVTAAVPPRPGPTSFLDFAMVHLAIHNAVASIDGQFQTYYLTIPGASGSPVAAAAKAAHDMLVNRFPAQAANLDTIYDNYLAAHLLAPNDPGVSVGQQAAAGIIALRMNDGSFPSPPLPPFVGGTGIGVWRPTAPGFAPMAVPWLGTMKPFALNDAAQFLANPPPALTSGLYTRDYNEVKEKGALNNSTRTAEETELAHFWNLNYPVIWQQVLQGIVHTHVNDLGKSARLFALATMALADGSMTAWSAKNAYVLWRPSTAIQEGDNDGNPATAGDPNWLPLIVNPPYPDHISGANCTSAALLRILHLFFGTNDIEFSVTTNNALAVQKTRQFRHFTDAEQEVVKARVFEGIHFHFADAEARIQGRKVAKWVFQHFLRPVADDGGDNAQP